MIDTRLIVDITDGFQLQEVLAAYFADIRLYYPNIDADIGIILVEQDETAAGLTGVEIAEKYEKMKKVPFPINMEYGAALFMLFMQTNPSVIILQNE